MPGTILRRRALGTEAAYRVLESVGDVVEVEVIEAPGLEPGTRVRLAARDAEAMHASDAGLLATDTPVPTAPADSPGSSSKRSAPPASLPPPRG